MTIQDHRPKIVITLEQYKDVTKYLDEYLTILQDKKNMASFSSKEELTRQRLIDLLIELE